MKQDDNLKKLDEYIAKFGVQESEPKQGEPQPKLVRTLEDKVNQIILGDCLDVLNAIPDNSMDLIATDPPYGISFMGKEWDSFNEGREQPSKMMKFFIPIWKECLRVLKDGAFAFVMCSPRQDVLCKQIIALQEAGFDTKFTSIYWTYATGFPKAYNIAKELKNRAAPEAESLNGSYGGFQPKPAVEVIIVAMKPLSEATYVEQALKNRKGITWLDDCRIPYRATESPSVGGRHKRKGKCITTGDMEYGFKSLENPEINLRGRFPANLIVSDDILNDGRITTTRPHGGDGKPLDTREQGWGFKRMPYEGSDSGSFSRYFDLDAWFEAAFNQLPENVQKVFPFLIVPKASKGERDKGLEDKRNIHPTVKPIKLMSYLITMGSREGDIVLDPFVGSGTTAIACKLLNRRYIGIDNNEEYIKIAQARLNSW